MSQLVFSVPGISCGHCANAISSEVGAVAGVSAVEVDIAARIVTVTGAPDPAAVRSAIAEAGYEVA